MRKCFKSINLRPSGFGFMSRSHVFPILVLLQLTVIFLSVQPLHASQELVQNGGFEDDFSGWTHTNAFAVTSQGGGYDALSHPAHSGTHSAKVGTVTNPGMISQSVTIPPKSSAKFVAWYRVEKGSSLTISLKTADGSLINQWAFSATVGVPVWTQVAYEVDVTYAGQSVTIEFDGAGYRETTSETTFEYYCDPVSGECYSFPVQFQNYNDYYAFVDDISMVASIAEYTTQIGITGLPPALSTTVAVDGQPQTGKMQVGQGQTLDFLLGSSHTISVDEYVMGDNTTRYHCAQPSVTVASDQSVTFNYVTQYFLSVSSPFSSTSGQGWYDEGSEASISISQNSIRMQGLLGQLGARYVFKTWAGDASGSSTTLQLTLDGPKTVSAVWVPDYSMFFVAVVAIVAAVASISGMLIRRQRRVGKRGTEIFPEDRPWVESDKTQIEVPQKGETELFKEEKEEKRKKGRGEEKNE